MSCHWNPTKKEIEEFLDKKIHEFATQQNRTSQVSKAKWLECYVYMEIQEIFFASFPSGLYEWIVKLSNIQGRFRLDKPILWTLELMRRLESSEDKIA